MCTSKPSLWNFSLVFDHQERRIGRRAINKRVTYRFFFLYQDTKMDLLVTHLDTYSRLGIPKLHHLVAFEAEDEVEEGIVYFCNGQTKLYVIRLDLFCWARANRKITKCAKTTSK